MWLIISAICIPVTILEMFSRTQFFTKTGGCRKFFSRPVAGLTNRGHVRDFRAGAPLHILAYLPVCSELFIYCNTIINHTTLSVLFGIAYAASLSSPGSQCDLAAFSTNVRSIYIYNITFTVSQ